MHWLDSYFSERSHLVQIDDRKSESVNVRFGVPQGSILDPMLFNLYVVDLPDQQAPFRDWFISIRWRYYIIK